MEENKELPLKKQLFTIPNLMGYFRILLIPLFIWRYLTADGIGDYQAAALIVALSGLTDLFDGKIARRFHMVTKLGKALDPVADKLTQAAMVLCLASRYRLMLPLLALFAVKEGFMGIMGLVMLRRGRMLNGAMWFGKVCTAVLYVVMFVLFLFPAIPLFWVYILIGICAVFMLFSLGMYIPVFMKMHKEGRSKPL